MNDAQADVFKLFCLTKIKVTFTLEQRAAAVTLRAIFAIISMKQYVSASWFCMTKEKRVVNMFDCLCYISGTDAAFKLSWVTAERVSVVYVVQVSSGEDWEIKTCFIMPWHQWQPGPEGLCFRVVRQSGVCTSVQRFEGNSTNFVQMSSSTQGWTEIIIISTWSKDLSEFQSEFCFSVLKIKSTVSQNVTRTCKIYSWQIGLLLKVHPWMFSRFVDCFNILPDCFEPIFWPFNETHQI